MFELYSALRWETSKISTTETESVREAGEWYRVVFYRLRTETSLIFQSAPRANYGFQIYCYCNFSSDFANVRESKILQDQLKFNTAEFICGMQNEGADKAD